MLSRAVGSGDPRIELVTLGRACCQTTSPNGATRSLLHGGKGLALLIYTALAPNRSVTRQQLIDLLWSNPEPNIGRADLRQALWYLRHVTDEAVITGAGEVLFVHTEIESDHQRFTHAVQSHDYGTALTAYGGDFLPMFAGHGGARFEHWADLERRRLRSLYCSAAETAVAEALGRGDSDEAIRIARTAAGATQTDRMDRLLTRALAADGATELLMRNGLADRDPESRRDTVVLPKHPPNWARHLEAPPRHSRTASSKELANARANEFADLREAWTEASQRQYVYRHVTGAPGTGKSRLLAEFMADIRLAPTCVAAVTARPVERSIPFSLLSKLAAALGQLRGARGISPTAARTLVSLNPTLSSIFYAEPVFDAPEDALRNRASAMRELITVLADEAPLCVVIDDMHHIDDASRQSLEAIAANLSREPVLFLTASCTSEERLA